MAVRASRRQKASAFQHDTRQQRAGGVRRQEHAVRDARIAVAEVLGEARHLRTVGIADEERRAPGQKRHRNNDGVFRDVADCVHDVGKAAHRPMRRRSANSEPRTVRRVHQPQDERQVEQGVKQDAMRRPKREHHGAAHRRPDQHAQVARRSIEPYRAHQIRWTDDLIEEELIRRLPQHAGAAMNDQQHHRMPHLQGSGDKKITPAQRCDDEQEHSALNDATRIEAIGKRADGHGKHQKRQPMRHHRETRQGWRMEFLKHHPVADDVLDVVRHHRQDVGEELGTESRMTHGREGSLRGRRLGCGA